MRRVAFSWRPRVGPGGWIALRPRVYTHASGQRRNPTIRGFIALHPPLTSLAMKTRTELARFGYREPTTVRTAMTLMDTDCPSPRTARQATLAWASSLPAYQPGHGGRYRSDERR